MTWSVRMTFHLSEAADPETLADHLEHLFDSLTEHTEKAFPAVSGTSEEEYCTVEVNLEIDAGNEVAALRGAIDLAAKAFRDIGISYSHLEHAELSREHTSQLTTI